MTAPKFCRQCGSPLTPASHFCANCGLKIDGPPSQVGDGGPAAGAVRPPAGGPAGVPGSIAVLLPWFILASLLMAGLGFAIGSRGASNVGNTAVASPFTQDGPIVSAPDISSLSPEERVDRLFNRVMSLAATGRQDSVQFFAPMAINALAALMPLDAHRRYDLGLIQLTAGDAAAARAQADTILAQHPTHLLGLSLAMRTAAAQDRTADARRLGALLSASAAAERAKRLPEYTDHAPDIAEALTEAAASQSRQTSPPR